MKILNSGQIKILDQETIAIQNISSWQLMERASEAVTNAILDKIKGQQPTFSIFCGKGNNGGDGLAIARILFRKISKSTFSCIRLNNIPKKIWKIRKD